MGRIFLRVNVSNAPLNYITSSITPNMNSNSFIRTRVPRQRQQSLRGALLQKATSQSFRSPQPFFEVFEGGRTKLTERGESHGSELELRRLHNCLKDDLHESIAKYCSCRSISINRENNARIRTSVVSEGYLRARDWHPYDGRKPYVLWRLKIRRKFCPVQPRLTSS